MDSDTKLTQTMKYQLSRNVFHLKGDFPPTKKMIGPLNLNTVVVVHNFL